MSDGQECQQCRRSFRRCECGREVEQAMTPEQQTIADLRQQLATAQDQFSQYLSGQVTLNEIAIKNGVISLESGTELARVMAAQFWEIVKDADNYVEMSMITDDGVKLCVTVQRCDGMTPHQLRRKAEQERDDALMQSAILNQE